MDSLQLRLTFPCYSNRSASCYAAPILLQRLRIDSVQGSSEGDGFADVVEAAEPGYDALDAHAEAGVGDGAVAAEVEVPLECAERQPVFLDARFQQVVGVDALGAADDLAVALG